MLPDTLRNKGRSVAGSSRIKAALVVGYLLVWSDECSFFHASWQLTVFLSIWYRSFTGRDGGSCTPDEKHGESAHVGGGGRGIEAHAAVDDINNDNDEPLRRHWGDDVVLKLTETGSVVSQLSIAKQSQAKGAVNLVLHRQRRAKYQIHNIDVLHEVEGNVNSICTGSFFVGVSYIFK